MSPIFRITQESPEIQGKLINPRVSGFDFKIFLKIFGENTAFCAHSVHESVHDCTRLSALQADDITDLVIGP